jgi:streptogramin lyase
VTYLMSGGWTLDLPSGKFTEVARGQRPQCRQNPFEVNPWDGGWSPGGGPRSVTYTDPATGTTKEFSLASVNRWVRPYNAIGDPKTKIGWSVPDVTDHMIKIDAATGQLTAWPLPSHGQEIRNIDIQLSVNPPAVWFINQRLGRVIRFQEFEP